MKTHLLYLATLAGCVGPQIHAQEAPPGALLPSTLGPLQRTEEVAVYVGRGLFEYINGGAEEFHRYGFVDVATAVYAHGETEIVVDLYRFREPVGAYGLYTGMRPQDPDTVRIGVEGYASTMNLDFVKGCFFGRLVAYDTGPETSAGMREAARALAGAISGTIERPALFSRFPRAHRLPFSDAIAADSFLGRQGLDDVYSQGYRIGDHAFRLFLSSDPEGSKLRLWSAQEGAEAMADLGLIGLEDPYHGLIVAARRGGYVLGAVSCDQACRPFVSDWLATFQP